MIYAIVRGTKKHSVYDNNIRYTQNDITNPFSVIKVNYAKHVNDVFELDILISPTYKKCKELDGYKWDKHDLIFYEK